MRYAWGVMLAAAAVFLSVASLYGPDTFFMRYGRKEAVSWNVWKAERLDEATLRAHEGGRVLWVVGSSITRDSFDEDAVNAALEEARSPYRLVKLGFTRGAPGVSLGLAVRLPIREGDVLATSVAAENFRRDWVREVGPPPDLLMKTVSPAGFWSVPSWTLADKLEQAAAVPHDFYAWHDETMDGVWSWAVDRIWYLRRARKAKPGWRLKHRNPEIETDQLDRGRTLGQGSSFYIPPGGLDLSPTQFNMAGLEGYAELAAERGAELVVLSIPTRQEYVARFLPPDVQADFAAWLGGREDVVYFPQPDESHYYDWKHPREEGRAVLSARLVEWLGSRDRGAPAPVSWPAPGYNRPTAPPRPTAKESP